VEPDPGQAAVYEKLSALYQKVYFGLGTGNAAAAAMGDILPSLRKIAAEAR
jgi:L-ribulokinase